MAKKFYWINFLLILIVIYLSIKNYEEWTNPKPRGKETADAKQKAPAPPSSAPVARKREMPPPAHYKVISEKNLFSIERKEFPPPLPPPDPATKEKPTPPPKPPARPNLTLYGVAIVGEDLRTALVNNPTRRPDKGEREMMTVRVGDRVGEYSVGKILEDRITMESTGDSFDVLLFDPGRQRKRVATPPGTATPTPADKPGQPPRVTPSPPRPFAPPANPPGGSPPSPREVPGRDLLRDRLEQRRLQRSPAGASQPPVQAPRKPPVSQKDEDDEDDED